MTIIGEEIITPIGAGGMRMVGPGTGIVPDPADGRLKTAVAMGDVVTVDQVTPLFET